MGNLSGLVAILYHRPKLSILDPHRQGIAAAHLGHAAHQLAGIGPAHDGIAPRQRCLEPAQARCGLD